MKTPHVHAEMIKEWAEDTSRVVECRGSASDKWAVVISPRWAPIIEYRFRHKHQDLIEQKAARPELIVEMKTRLGVWVRMDMVLWDMVLWDENNEYRLVEPPKKKVKMWQWVVKHDTKIYLSDFFYGTEELARAMSLGKVIQRADWTEIEVEVDE